MNATKKFILTKSEKSFCVKLARDSINYSLSHDDLLKLNNAELETVPKKLLTNKASFVTLTINNSLRGCIGHLIAHKPLYKDIIENSFSAAFSDPRFAPLSKNEFDFVSIEVSVLTDPKRISFTTPAELLKKIKSKKDGLIIRKGFKSATFLPSVWEEIDSKEEFLSDLCLKAGLDKDEWQKSGLTVERYYTIKAK